MMSSSIPSLQTETRIPRWLQNEVRLAYCIHVSNFVLESDSKLFYLFRHWEKSGRSTGDLNLLVEWFEVISTNEVGVVQEYAKWHLLSPMTSRRFGNNDEIQPELQNLNATFSCREAASEFSLRSLLTTLQTKSNFVTRYEIHEGDNFQTHAFRVFKESPSIEEDESKSRISKS